MSSGDNAQIDFTVRGSVGAPEFNLANMGGNFQITSESQIAIKIVAKEKLTPLCGISTLRRIDGKSLCQYYVENKAYKVDKDTWGYNEQSITEKEEWRP